MVAMDSPPHTTINNEKVKTEVTSNFKQNSKQLTVGELTWVSLRDQTLKPAPLPKRKARQGAAESQVPTGKAVTQTRCAKSDSFALELVYLQ